MELPISTAHIYHIEDLATAAYSALAKPHHEQTKLLFLLTQSTEKPETAHNYN